MEESKNLMGPRSRVFGVVCRARPEDFQAWLEAGRSYDIYIIFSKSSRIGKLKIEEVPWE